MWLNGKEVFKFAETRVLEKDASRVAVTLVKGQNVLVLKVVNEVNNWQACARFLKDRQPVTGLRIATAPLSGRTSAAPGVVRPTVSNRRAISKPQRFGKL